MAEPLMPDHERIWLEPQRERYGEDGRLWCQHDVWADGEDGPPTEYVRADLHAAALREAEARARLKTLREVRSWCVEARSQPRGKGLLKCLEAIMEIERPIDTAIAAALRALAGAAG